MVEVKGKGNIVARVIADSVSSVSNKRITTFELEYHRYIHAEFMTHRMFSRNAASSRAIPVAKMLETVRNSPATPIHWGKNQPGMQANEECIEPVQLFQNKCGDKVSRERAWQVAMSEASLSAENFNEAGYHKQIVNRLTEPFQMMKVVCTATEYENFFWLRDHAAAQPEIAELARCMKEARELSMPMELQPGDWHVPYFEGGYWIEEMDIPLEDALKISSSCCAQVSYRKTDDSLEKAIDIYDKLLASDRKHASPFEHQASPINLKDIEYWGDWSEGITHADRNGNLWSGNFQGWVQHRQLIGDHVRW